MSRIATVRTLAILTAILLPIGGLTGAPDQADAEPPPPPTTATFALSGPNPVALEWVAGARLTIDVTSGRVAACVFGVSNNNTSDFRFLYTGAVLQPTGPKVRPVTVYCDTDLSGLGGTWIAETKENEGYVWSDCNNLNQDAISGAVSWGVFREGKKAKKVK